METSLDDDDITQDLTPDPDIVKRGRPYYELPLDLEKDKTPDFFRDIPESTIETNRFLYSSIIHGLGPIKVKSLLLDFDIQVDTNSYYRILKPHIAPMLDLAVKSCSQSLTLSNNHKIVSIDGSWSRPKNGTFCIVDLIDVTTTQLIDFQIVTTEDIGVIHDHLSLKPGYSPKALEHFGIEAIAERNALKIGTDYFVHDGDVEVGNIITKEKNINCTLRSDPNHYAKNLFSVCYKPGPLYGLGDALTNKYKHVLKTMTGDKRNESFKAYYDYLISDTSFWENKNNFSARNQLKDLIYTAAESFNSVESGMHTCYNEAFHFVRNVYAPKNENFKIGWVARVIAAIIHWNHRRNFRTILRNFF